LQPGGCRRFARHCNDFTVSAFSLQTVLQRLPAACAALLPCLALPAKPEAEHNWWPVAVARTDTSGRVQDWQAAGPLFFHRPTADGGSYTGFRPFYLERRDAAGQAAESSLLYPLYIRRQDATTTSWSVFNLINHSAPADPATAGIRAFDVWPFYFSRDTGSADSSYRALFPVAGTVKRRFGQDELGWVLFPLHLRTVKDEITTTSILWPVFRHSAGGGHQGFAVWPLFARAEKPGFYRRQHYLWPLIYKTETGLDEPQPTIRQGFLPFYTRESSPESHSENYLWPFFGHTRQTEPAPYREIRYFWPLLVQGRGNDREVNRWAPFYSRSVRKGVEKTWLGWPLIKEVRWSEGDLDRQRRQLLFFLYWSEEQRSRQHPGLPAAHKTHVWPLLSTWDNGAGRRQLQFPSPLEVFFPHNEQVRQLYTPLFALYRFDRRGPDEVRASLLWSAITWHRHPEGRAFRIGPLFSNTASPDEGRRIALGHGLIGLRQLPGGKGWRMFLFDFPRRPGQPAAPAE
jgi:hypothetical protein